MLVRYEDLCQNTDSIMERLFDFCGVDTGIRIEDFRTAPHHIVGNAMRLKKTSAIKLDERWKTELTVAQLKEIDRTAGTLSRQYGY